jgi:hypothetical protein
VEVRAREAAFALPEGPYDYLVVTSLRLEVYLKVVFRL